MPIKHDALDEDEPTIPVKPGTNAHALLSVLAGHEDLAFSPSELAELTDVAPASVGKTLARLAEKGLVDHIDGYWTVADDVAATQLAGMISLDAIEDRYGDDEYGRTDDWAADLPDLGENG